MKHEFLELREAAEALGMDPEELARLAKQGDVPAHSRGNRFVFSREEIDHWMEERIGAGDRRELVRIEETICCPRMVVTPLLRPEAVHLDLPARTKSAALRALVRGAVQTGLVYDAEALLDAVLEREELLSTAVQKGIALPHPRRPDPYLAEESLIVFGRTPAGIPFGAPDGRLTDLFFLLVSCDDRIHLRILARLTRMLDSPEFRDQLRFAEDPDEVLEAVRNREQDLNRN